MFEIDEAFMRMNGVKTVRIDYTPYRVKGFTPNEHRRIGLVIKKLELQYGLPERNFANQIKAGVKESLSKE